MIFPEILDRVCMVKKIEDKLAIIIIDPDGASGSIMLSVDEAATLIQRLKQQAPELENVQSVIS